MEDRKRQIIKIALDCFTRNGLISTSIKDVAKDVGVRPGALYYYFENKEEMVIQCADLAIEELSEYMVSKVLSFLREPETMPEKVINEARKQMPLMRFLVSVKVSLEYGDKIRGAIAAFSSRYESYAQRTADTLCCDVEQIKPIAYMMIVSTVNYMIFGEDSLFLQQLSSVQKMLGF